MKPKFGSSIGVIAAWVVIAACGRIGYDASPGEQSEALNAPPLGDAGSMEGAPVPGVASPANADAGTPPVGSLGTLDASELPTAPPEIDAGPPEVDAPAPTLIGWAMPPTASGPSAIVMTATTVTAPEGVEYYFTCVTGECDDSGWQASPTYTDTELQPGAEYWYSVRARDLSTSQNETEESTTESASTPPAQGALAPLYEPFDESAGLDLLGLNGGRGFAAPWSASQLNGSSEIGSSNNLVYPGLSTAGNALRITAVDDATTAVFSREAAIEIRTVAGPTWVSFLLRAEKLAVGHLFMFINFGGTLPFGKRWVDEISIDNNPTPTHMVEGQTYFIVVRNTPIGSEVRTDLWVNPEIGLPLSATPPDTTKEGRIEQGRTVNLGFQGQGLGSYDVDELRIGYSWNEVSGGQSGFDDISPPSGGIGWAAPLQRETQDSVRMTAEPLTDPWDVQYYFDCVSGGGPDSGWIPGSEWVAPGLGAGQSYTYRVKARDVSVNLNETPWSPEATVTLE